MAVHHGSTHSIFNIFANETKEDIETKARLLQSTKNANENIQNSEDNSKTKVLNWVDIFISTFLVNIAVVCFWTSTFNLLEVYKTYFSIVPSLIWSSSVHLILTIEKEQIHRLFCKERNSFYENILYKVSKRMYIYVFAVVSVVQWRSMWTGFDYLCDLKSNEIDMPIPSTAKPSLIVGTMAVLCLFSLKCGINLMGSPFVICLDRNKEIFEFSTRFKIQASEQIILYILDCLFSVMIIGTLVVFVWRGGWVLCDLLIFPDDMVVSSWASLIIGYASVAVAFLLEPCMKWLCNRISGPARLLVADLFLIFSFVGTINVWRGIWNLLNINFLPENLEMSCWITHWVSLIVLILLGCSNSLLVRGVYIDAEEPAGDCVVFPCQYLRIILQNQRKKKLKLKINLENIEIKHKNLDQIKIAKDLENNCTVSVVTIPPQNVELNHKDTK